MPPSGDKLNFLRVSELDRTEMKKLIDADLPELKNYPTSNIHTFSSNKDLLTIEKEIEDVKNASKFAIHIVMFKTKPKDMGYIPDRFVFKFRFY